jgi:hypothetical protein
MIDSRPIERRAVESRAVEKRAAERVPGERRPADKRAVDKLPGLHGGHPQTPGLAPDSVPPAFVASVRHGHEEDDEDEDDDTNFVPPFDLLDTLARGGLAGPSARQDSVNVEVIRYREDRVLSVRHLGGRGSLRLPGAGADCGARGADGSFVLYPAACGPLSVRQDGRSLGASETRTLTDSPTMRLAPGMQVVMDAGLVDGEKVMVHLVPRAPALAPPRTSFRPTADRVGPTALSFGVHVGLFLIIGLAVLGGQREEAADINAGRFATINVKEMELEPPPPKPPDPEPTPPDNAPTLNAPQAHSAPQTKPTKGPRTPAQQGQAGERESTASAQRILSALGGAAAPSGLNVAAITNLDAVPHGEGGFKVSGVVGKAPGDSLRVSAGGGGGEVNTKSANEIGGNVGRVHATGSGSVVRARVTTAPPGVQGEGHLDRGEIQRVINAHIYQIQGCYERQLMKDPSLAGKVSFQWVIALSGAVSGVRVGQSSLRSAEVTSCIQSAIQGWHFPQPQGGSVTITYPFSFIGS